MWLKLLKDVPFFCVRKTLSECSLFVADTLDTGERPGGDMCSRMYAQYTQWT